MDVLRRVWGIFCSASKRMCNRKWEVRVGAETQGCPTCFCLSFNLQREGERESDWNCARYEQSERQVLLWGILPQQTSIITCCRNLHGDCNVFFNNSKSWTLSLSSHIHSYRRLSDTCTTNAYLCHSTCYGYRGNVAVECKVYNSHKKPLRYMKRMCESTVQPPSVFLTTYFMSSERNWQELCLINKSAACFGWLLTEEIVRCYLFSISAGRKEKSLDGSLSVGVLTESQGRVVLFYIEPTLGPQRAESTKEPAFFRLFLRAQIVKVRHCSAQYTHEDICTLIALWENKCFSRMQTICALSTFLVASIGHCW